MLTSYPQTHASLPPLLPPLPPSLSQQPPSPPWSSPSQDLELPHCHDPRSAIVSHPDIHTSPASSLRDPSKNQVCLCHSSAKTTEQQPIRLQWHKGSSWSGSGPCLPVYSDLLPPPHHTELLALPLRHQHPHHRHLCAHPCCPLGLEGLPPTPVSLDNSSSILQGSAVAPPPPGSLP